MSSSVIGSVLESFLGSIQSSRRGVCHREKLGAYSEAGWECAIEFKSVLQSILESMQ